MLKHSYCQPSYIFPVPDKTWKWYHTLPRLLWWRRSQTSWRSVDLPSLSSVCLHLPWSNPFCHSFQKIDTQTLWRGPTFFVLVDEKILWDLFCCIKLRVMTENPEKHQPKIDNSEMVKSKEKMGVQLSSSENIWWWQNHCRVIMSQVRRRHDRESGIG